MKKKFYITDIPSVVNALNYMGDTYDNNFKKQEKINGQVGFILGVSAFCLYLASVNMKKMKAEINDLKADIEVLKVKDLLNKTKKEGCNEAKGE